MKVWLDHIKDEAENIKTFFWRTERPVQYTAGQYATWTLEHPNPDDRGVNHWFTISSSPTEELVTITTKFAGEDKSSSFKRTLFQLQPGAQILMSDPMGDFVLPKLVQTPLVFVAGGIGITPFHSMLGWLNATHEQRPIKLLYAVRNEDEIIFQETFDKVGIKPIYVVSEPSESWGGERGHLNAEMIVGLTQPTEDTLVYVSGPEGMVQDLSKRLVSQGVNKQQVVTDEFPNYDPV